MPTQLRSFHIVVAHATCLIPGGTDGGTLSVTVKLLLLNYERQTYFEFKSLQKFSQ